MDKINFNQSLLIDFIIKAKQNTYAKSGEVEEKVLADGSKELVFKEKQFVYRDRYFGFNPFAGQEVVFQNKQAIWAMNYYGWMISKKVSAKQIYHFLKQALSKVMADKPFRGPDNLQWDDFRYVNKAYGTVKKFSGKEQIFYKNKITYKLCYHGGVIVDH